MASSGEERSEESRVEESGCRSLLELVVRISRLSTSGMRLVRAAVKSATVEVAGRGSERVGGRPRPGKEVRRTLMVEGAMACRCEVTWTVCRR